MREGAVAFVFTGVYERTTSKYGERGIRYVHIEVGHAAQNLCLQATAIELGGVTVGAFSDEQPFYIVPVGGSNYSSDCCYPTKASFVT